MGRIHRQVSLPLFFLYFYLKIYDSVIKQYNELLKCEKRAVSVENTEIMENLYFLRQQTAENKHINIRNWSKIL